MKQRLLYILLMITTALSWSLETGAQTYADGTWYSFYWNGSQDWVANGDFVNSDIFAPTNKTISLEYKKYAGLSTTGSLSIYEMDENGKETKSGSQGNIKSTSYSTYNGNCSENFKKIRVYKDGGTGVTVRNVFIPLGKHILLDNNSTYGTKSMSVTPYSTEQTGVGNQCNTTYTIKLRSFLTTKDITVTSNNTAFHFDNGGTSTTKTFAVGANACASANGNGNCGNGTLGKIDNYNIDVYFTPAIVGENSGTITITDGTSTATVNLKGDGYPMFYFSASAPHSIGGTTTASPTVTSIQGETTTQNSASTTATFTAISNEGYKFSGWKTSENDEEYINTTTPYTCEAFTNNNPGSTENKSLFAVFSPITYYVKYNGNGSTGTTTEGIGTMPNQLFTYDEVQTLSPNTYIRTHTISFDSDGGSSVSSVNVESSFAGWSRINNGTVDYEDEGRAMNLSTKDGDIFELFAIWTLGSPEELPIPQKAGYTFSGWFDGSIQAEANTYKPDHNVTLNAHWNAAQYTITLNPNGGEGGTATADATFDAAMPSGRTAPTRTGYTFAGYFDAPINGTQYYDADMTSAKAWDKANDATLYAHWTANTFTVNFNGNGNTGGSMASQEFTYDQAQALTSNGFSRQYTITFNTDGGDAMDAANVAYTFGGWATSANGDAVYENQKSVSNLATSGDYTLYATWSTDYVLPLPTKAGYNFAGWYDDENNVGMNGVGYAPESNVTLTAHWTQDLLVPSFVKNYDDAAAKMHVDDELANAFTLANVSNALEVQITPADVVRCEIANGKATIVALNAGTATLKFVQQAEGNISAGQSENYTFTVTKNVGTIESLLPATIGITSELTLNLIASYNKGGISDDVAVVLNVSSDNESVLKYEDGKLKALALGNANVTITQADNYKYTATDVVVPVEVVKNNDELTWTEGKIYTFAANNTHNLTGYATSTNGQTVKYELVGPNDADIATIDGNILTPKAAGTITIKAYTEESANYNAAECATTQTITIEKATPVVNWKAGVSSPINMEALCTLDINDYATASTGATVTYTTDQADIVSIDGNILTAHKSGSVTLTASIAATHIYNAASNTLTITVSKIASKIVWNQILPALTDKTTGSIPLTAVVVAMNDESKTDASATVTYTSSANNVVSISGTNMNVTGQGNATITASFAGDEVFDATTSVSKDVTVTGYNVQTTWVNDWTSEPVLGEQFYIYNTTNSKFLQAGHGEESTNAFVDANGATLWDYTGNRKIVSSTNTSHFITNRTNQASTNGQAGGIGIHKEDDYRFNFNNEKIQIYSGAYDLFNNNGIFDGYNNGNHYEWWLISKDQYDYRMTDIPTAVSKYLYGEGADNDKYNRVHGKTRQNLVDATQLNSNFAAARTTIAAAMQAFDDYLEELDKIEAFQASIAANTPDVTAAQTDVDNAIAALQDANGSTKIKAVYANKITRKFTAISATYPTLLPKASAGNVDGAVKSGEDEVDVTITYTSNNTTILTVSATGEIQPLKEGTATITLTTTTTDDYYAAMPFTTDAIEVTDRLTLSNANVANYTPGEYGTVILSRTLKQGYNSIALPFNTDLASLGADNAYQLSIVTYNAKDGYSLYFKEATSIVANEPYIIHVTTEKVNPQFTDVTVETATAIEKQATGGVNAGGHAYTDWVMHSNYTPSLSMEGKYGIVNNLIMKGGAGSTLNAFTAYITGPANTRAAVKAAYLNGEEETGILEALMGEQEPQEVYDLQGRKLPTTQRGINIVRQNDGSVKKIMR